MHSTWRYRVQLQSNILVHPGATGVRMDWLADFEYAGDIAVDGTLPPEGSNTQFVAPEILLREGGEDMETIRKMNEKAIHTGSGESEVQQNGPNRTSVQFSVLKKCLENRTEPNRTEPRHL